MHESQKKIEHPVEKPVTLQLFTDPDEATIAVTTNKNNSSEMEEWINHPHCV